MKRHYQNIFVACSYKRGPTQHASAIIEFSLLLGEHHYNLIYGGGIDGHMGFAVDFYHTGLKVGQNNKHPVQCAKAISTEFYAYATGREVPMRLLGQLNKINVKDLQERKRRIVSESDLIIVFPGGIQTMDELFEFAAMNGYNRATNSSSPIKHIICVEPPPHHDSFEWLKIMLAKNVRDGYTSTNSQKMFHFVKSGYEAFKLLEKLNQEEPKPLSTLIDNGLNLI